MSFVLEEVKNGRDIILFNNNKFREGYSLKNSDIVWRCLGKVCKASIRTNKEKTTIYLSNDSHTGAHPVTLRALTPTPPNKRRNLPTATPEAEPKVPVVTSMSTPEPNRVATTISSSPTTPSMDLASENALLKEEVARLRAELQVVLNHSIESDQRLLEFTDNVFLPPRSLTSNTSFSSSTLPKSEDSQLAVQKIKALEEEIQLLRRPCKTCDILKDETKNMLNSIRCLEEEKKLIKASITTDTNPLTTHSLKVRNTYDVLGEDLDDKDGTFVQVTSKKTTRPKNGSSHKHNKRLNSTKQDPKLKFQRKTIAFQSVSVMGDSHVRGLAALMKNQINNSAVSGVCKPGGRLKDITPISSPPRNHCYIIVAGANDVGARTEDDILADLEHLLQVCRKSSRVLLVPIPTRYDLSRHSHVHNTVAVVNGYMAELCRRHPDMELLDTKSIRRHHHTNHGLHLNKKGKHLLSNLLVERLALMSLPTTHLCSPLAKRRVLPAASVAPPPLEPRTLPYETYAEAVNQPTRHITQHLNFNRSHKSFLENPLHATVLN